MGFRKELYLDFDEVHGLHHSRSRGEERRVEDATRRRDDLSAPAMNGVRVQRHVVDVKADAAQVLVAENALKREELTI